VDAEAPPTSDGGVDDPLETHYFPTCVIISNFVILGQIVWAQIEGPKNWGEAVDAGAPPPLDGAWMTPRNTLLPHVLSYQISSLRSNCLGIGRGCQKFRGGKLRSHSLGMEAWLTPET